MREDFDSKTPFVSMGEKNALLPTGEKWTDEKKEDECGSLLISCMRQINLIKVPRFVLWLSGDV